MSISVAGGQAVSQLLRTSFKPPSFETLDKTADGGLTLDELAPPGPKGTAGSDANGRAEALLKAMDGDGNGSVSLAEKDSFDARLSEQRQGMAFMTQQMSSPSNADIFAATDTDGDGAVSLAELSDDDAASEAGADALKKIFELIDGDGNGSISASESADFLDAIRSAIDQRLTGGPPPAAAADTEANPSTLFSVAQSAYRSSQQQTLLEQLTAIFDSAA